MLNKRGAGFSLVEMVVASAAMVVVVVYTMGTFTVHHQTSTVISDVSEAQQNMRAVSNMIERDIRNSGYMVPTTAAVCGTDFVAAPDRLFLSDTDAILPVDGLPAEFKGLILGASTTTSPAASTGLPMTVDNIVIDGTPSYFKDVGSAALDSDFRVGGGAIAVDIGNPARGSACGVVTRVSANTVEVAFSSALGPIVAPVGAVDLKLIPAHVYQIDTVPTPNELQRDGLVLAKSVEDLQAAFFVDANGDGIVDATEYKGDTGLNLYDSAGTDASQLREVRFHVVVATMSDDPRDPATAGRGQARENRTLASVPALDGRHRRSYTSVVRIRNNNL